MDHIELKIKDWYLLTKINRIIIPIACFLLGLFSFSTFSLLSILPIVSIALIYASAASLNDVFDFNIDRISNPERPIPARKLDFPAAYFIVVSFILVGLISAYLVGLFFDKPYFIGFGLAGFVLGIIYSMFTSKHFITATATLATSHGLLVFLSAVYLFDNFLNDKAIFLGAIIWLILFLTYNIKDFKDIQGDTGNRTTLPVLLGLGASKQVMRLLFIVLLPIALVVNFSLKLSLIGLFLSLAFATGLIYLGNKLVTANEKEDFTSILNNYRYLMSGYILSFLF